MSTEIENNEKKPKKTVLHMIMDFKEWILGFGILGFVLWWGIKLIVCLFFGICLI